MSESEPTAARLAESMRHRLERMVESGCDNRAGASSSCSCMPHLLYRELLPIVQTLQETAARLKASPLKCAHCDKAAVCFGIYENPQDPVAFACGSCCGHGNEDGWCRPIEQLADWATSILRNTEVLSGRVIAAESALTDCRAQLAQVTQERDAFRDEANAVRRNFTRNVKYAEAAADAAESRLQQQTQAIRAVVRELNEALQAGALFNPESFGLMLRRGDNPILRWRNELAALQDARPSSQ
jgi:hypothetical protein